MAQGTSAQDVTGSELTAQHGATPAADAHLDFFIRAFAPEHREDPYPLYCEERDRNTLLDAGSGLWFAFGYDECALTLRSPWMSSDERRSTMYQLTAATDERLAALAEEPPMLLFMDPPDHTRLRGLVMRAFTPSSSREPEIVRFPPAAISVNFPRASSKAPTQH